MEQPNRSLDISIVNWVTNNLRKDGGIAERPRYLLQKYINKEPVPEQILDCEEERSNGFDER